MRLSSMVALVGVVALLAGCGGEPEIERPAGETETTGVASHPVRSAEPADESCPSFGEPASSWNAAGTPLLFSFRYPDGFEVQQDATIGESMHQILLKKDVRFAGASRTVSIEIIQSLRPTDHAIPIEVKTMRDQKDNPTIQAMRDMAPTEAGEISFGGEAIPVFRVSTDSKVIYKFNLPKDGSYRSVNVHFNAIAIGSMCLERLEDLGEAWVGTVSPPG